MALALAPRIRVNGIGPGPTLPSPRQSARAISRPQCRMMPLRRGTSPEEIAAALRFILAAPAMTGQMIALDGGQHLGWAQPGQGGRSSNDPKRVQQARQNASSKSRIWFRFRAVGPRVVHSRVCTDCVTPADMSCL